MTLQDQYVAALIQFGGRHVPSRSKKYVTFTRFSGGFFFVGKSGSVREGQTYKDSIPSSGAFKRYLLTLL